MKYLEAWAWDNVPDRSDDGPAEGYLMRKRAFIETMRIGLTSANMPIPEMLEDGWQSIFDQKNIYKIYILAALLDQVHSWLIFKGQNQMPITMQNTMQVTIPMTILNAMPSLCLNSITENITQSDPDPDSANPSNTTTISIDDCKSTSESSPSKWCSLRHHMRLVEGKATTFKRGGWWYQNLKQPLPQTITIPEGLGVKWCQIHQQMHWQTHPEESQLAHPAI